MALLYAFWCLTENVFPATQRRYCFLFKAGFVVTFVHCYLEMPTQWVLPSLRIELFASFVRLLSWKVTQPISVPNRIPNDYFLIFKVRFAKPICWKVTQPLCQLHTEGTLSFRRSDYRIFVAFSSWKVTQAIWLDKHYQSIKHSEKFIMCNVKKP
jgi:hypothetical protein